MGRFFEDGEGSSLLGGLLLVAVIGAGIGLVRGARALTDRFGDLGLVGALGLLVTAALIFGIAAEGQIARALLVGAVAAALSVAAFVLGARATDARRKAIWKRHT